MGLLDGIADEGVNFADVQAPSFDALPSGWYPCAITDISHSTSKADSKKYPNVPMINVEFTIQSGDFENRRFWRNYLVHPDFLGYLKQLFLGVGYSEEEVNTSGFDPSDDELMGREVDVKVNRKKSDYSGDLENNVTGLALAGSKTSGGSSSGSGESLLP
jgi:hypothetical protein